MWIIIIYYVGIPLSAIAGMAVILYYLFGEHGDWIGMASNIMALFMLVGAVIGFLSSLHELVYSIQLWQRMEDQSQLQLV